MGQTIAVANNVITGIADMGEYIQVTIGSVIYYVGDYTCEYSNADHVFDYIEYIDYIEYTTANYY